MTKTITLHGFVNAIELEMLQFFYKIHPQVQSNPIQTDKPLYLIQESNFLHIFRQILGNQSRNRIGTNYLLIAMRKEPDEAREDSGVEDGADAGVESACEAPDDGGGLDEEVGVAIVGAGGGEDGGDSGDEAELDVGELLGAVTDDAVLELPESLDLDFVLRRGQPRQEVGVAARGRHRRLRS